MNARYTIFKEYLTASYDMLFQMTGMRYDNAKDSMLLLDKMMCWEF
ncbi:hypothetical protein [Scytonema sp. NUACC26]